jgi:hypothetical protein
MLSFFGQSTMASKYDNMLKSLSDESPWSEENETVRYRYIFENIIKLLHSTGAAGTIHLHHFQSGERNSRTHD